MTEQTKEQNQENNGFRLSTQEGLLVVEHKSGDYIALAHSIGFDAVQWQVNNEVFFNEKFKPKAAEEEQEVDASE